ncbi:hypothetical protein L3X38_043184 [Prunus dulcis]|uniref:Uncharacterized protein n=1 Tax=Prunus dulcis TaxID=3755 RepID=A0AAD4UXB1_PRUDU|nr:hypothetical protein L3X38_043184 [Prunus dulcis]
MSRLLPGMEMVGYAPSCQCSYSFFVWWSGVSGSNFWQPTANVFRDLFKGCDFAVGESAGDMETILEVVIVRWNANEGDNEEKKSHVIKRKRKRTAKIAEQTNEVEEHAQIQSEAEEDPEAAVEPHSSPLGTTQASQIKRVKTFAQKHKIPKVENLTRSETAGASPTPIVSRACHLADLRIHELAEKPGLVLPVVLKLTKPVRTYSSKTRKTSKISAPPSKAKKTVSVEKLAETTTVIKSPVTQQTSKVPTPQPSTKDFETQTVSSTYKITEVASSVDTRKKVMESPKRVRLSQRALGLSREHIRQKNLRCWFILLQLLQAIK